jgi:transcriptional regulator of met regulon
MPEVKRLTVFLPAAVAKKLKALSRRRSRKELRQVTLSNVVLDAVAATYFRPRRRRRRAAAPATRGDA